MEACLKVPPDCGRCAQLAPGAGKAPPDLGRAAEGESVDDAVGDASPKIDDALGGRTETLGREVALGGLDLGSCPSD